MKRIRKEKGQSLTELALVLPIMLIILAGLLDLGRLYYAYVSISDAAAEGAAYAAINPTDDTEIATRTQTASNGLVQVDPGLVNIDCPTVAVGAPVTVTVGYEFTVATPLINAMVPGGVLTLRAVATEAILSGEM
ncbi:MAG: TadE/TadG family type IV pilus assembly protein [Chloroflexota bacterium]|nr:TadE/TadG family type IV pilus assembly protein [Chloroflexota bacterium]